MLRTPLQFRPPAAAVRPLRAWFRRYVLKLWQSRGGGFYGFVATLMFLYLEVVDIAGDLVSLGGARPSLGWLISFVVGNLVDVVINTVHAAIWPATWLRHFGVGLTSAGMMAVVYFGYLAVRPRVMQWLQSNDDATDRRAVPGYEV